MRFARLPLSSSSSVRWAGHDTVTVDDVALPIIGRAELIENKAAAARDKDILDLKLLARG